MAQPTLKTRCCIVGGGPAGMMAGLLFARAGVDTVVIEKHEDFLRDFRGDTVHPSTMEALRDIGLLEPFLERPHERLETVCAEFEGNRYTLAEFRRLPVGSKFIAFMPQWHFLDFLADEAQKLPAFDLRMNWNAVDLIETEDGVAGVVADTPEGRVHIEADLTIGADGRGSVVRDKAGLKVRDLGAPIDVLWFRVPRSGDSVSDTLLHAAGGNIVVTIDRGDYWQCAFIIPKGMYDKVVGRGIDRFRRDVLTAAGHLAPHIGAVTGWDDVKVLTVRVDRLEDWSRPGLVVIGDAAHAMSPIGGVGINLAIQDAVAAANLFAGPLRDGTLTDTMLGQLRRRRLGPTRVVQAVQLAIQSRLIEPILKERRGESRAPLPLRIVNAVPWLRGWTARFLGLGLRREHVRSPNM